MQMTMVAAPRPGPMHAFALKKGSGYVMRSEKRPGYGGGGSPNRRGRKPRRPRAGILYILLTMLLLIILWPVGLVMLWSRKVRMQAGTKLLISLLTLCVSVFLIVFALTVPVDNPKITEYQDKANDWLNRAASDVAVAGDAAYKKGMETWGVMKEFADNVSQPVANALADGIDAGVKAATGLRSKIENRPGSDISIDKPTEVVTEVPATATPSPRGEDVIDIHIPENTPDPDSAKPLSGGLLSANGSFTADATPKPTPTPTPAPASKEAEAVENGDKPEDEIVWTDASEEDAAVVSKSAPAEAEGDAAEAPGETSDTGYTVKAAADATVYYNKNGRLYHMRSSCKNMKQAPAHTLAEALADGKQKCTACGAPDPGILEIEHVAWVDEKKVYHTSDECARFDGTWTLISLENAIEDGDTPCPDCGAEAYANEVPGSAEKPEPTEAATAEPTGEPSEAPSEAPTETPKPTETPEPTETATAAPKTVSPAAALKPVGDVTVYHSSNGKFYHRFNVCKGMTGSSPYKLSEITSRFRRCTLCDAPDTALVGQTCLWMDEDGLCHTADTCAKFKGDYTFILRDDALKEGKAGCPDCGADEYLIPNTTLKLADAPAE